MHGVNRVGAEVCRGVGLEDSSHAIEVPSAFHAGQCDVRLPGPTLPRESETVERGLKRVRDARDWFGPFHAHPDYVHSPEAGERAGPSDADVKGAKAGGRLLDCGHDLRHKPLLRVAEELDRQMELAGADDLQGRARLFKVPPECVEDRATGHVDRDETSERHRSSRDRGAGGCPNTNRSSDSNVPST